MSFSKEIRQLSFCKSLCPCVVKIVTWGSKRSYTFEISSVKIFVSMLVQILFDTICLKKEVK